MEIYYKDLMVRFKSDKTIKFGIRAAIPNIYEPSNSESFAREQIIICVKKIFPQYEISETKQRRSWMHSWPFNSGVYIDTLFTLQLISKD